MACPAASSNRRSLARFQSPLGLAASSWVIAKDSLLGVLCFVPANNASPAAIAADVTRRGKAWISTTKFEGREVLRACVTSHFTREEDIDRIVVALNCAVHSSVDAGFN